MYLSCWPCHQFLREPLIFGGYRFCPVSAWPNCGTASATTSLTNCHPGVSHVPKTAMLSHCFHDFSSPQNASLAKRCMPQGFQCGVSRIRTTPTYFQNLRLRQVREGHLKWRVPKPMVCLSQPHVFDDVIGSTTCRNHQSWASESVVPL